MDLRSDARFDSFGRKIRTRLWETGSTFIATLKDYDALGRVAWTSNPYRPGSEAPQYTDYTYDALGRPRTVTTPDTAVAKTTYADNLTTTVDQAQKKRTATSDALGRVLSVVEDPGGLDLTTSYTYGVFDQLTGVAQGSQTRTFTYDSLARLYQATNPESGTTTYAYFPGGELKTRTDAANSVTTYTYDLLNRVKTKVYSGGPATPNVTYTYDDAAVEESKGRLTKTQTSASTSQILAYDQLGRVLQSSQTTGSRTYPFVYSYDRAGNLATEKYPSDRVVTVTYDLAARPTQVADATTAFASSATYFSHGAVADFQLGNSLYEHASYNSRLQLDQIGLGLTAVSDVFQLTYGYGGSANNGNVLSQDIRHTVNSASTTWSQTYSYDALNRLKTTTEPAIAGGAQWSQTNSFDRYGNRWISSSSLPLPALTPTAQADFDAASNRLTGGLNLYSLAGNHTQDKLGRKMTYDAENRMVQFEDEFGVTSTYSYDGDGKRVHANVDGAGTTYVYDALGRLAGEYGRASANPVAGAQYLMRDHLGSVRVVTGPTGTVLARHDYFVFGDEIDSSLNGRGTLYAPTDNLRQRFTGQLRDSESGLDYFGARYYGAKTGRFTAVDPVYTWKENLVDPQRWNRYAYVRNSPLRYVDPEGRSTIAAGDGRVLEVREDTDLGVYVGKKKVGETAYWDEFRRHDGNTGAVLADVIPGARIDFGSSWDPAIRSDNDYSKFLGLYRTSQESKNNKYFDIKVDTDLSPDGPGTGRLLKGKYATAESAGNYLAGLNMATGRWGWGWSIARDDGMRLAGLLQQGQWSWINGTRALFLHTSWGPPPYFGETTHAGRWIDEGFRDGLSQ